MYLEDLRELEGECQLFFSEERALEAEWCSSFAYSLVTFAGSLEEGTKDCVVCRGASPSSSSVLISFSGASLSGCEIAGAFATGSVS